MKTSLRELWAEAIGTFILVFAGTGAIVIDDQTAALGHVGIALTFGLVVLALSYAATSVFAVEDPHDLVVYGGTSGGVVAAVQAARTPSR